MTQLSSIFENSPHLSHSEMLDYVDGKLSGNELHRAEHHLSDCRFCSDSTEGLRLITVTEAKDILEKTDEKVRKSVHPKKENAEFIYRLLVSAAVFLTLIIASFVLNYYLHHENKQVAQEIKTQTDSPVQPVVASQEPAGSETGNEAEKKSAGNEMPPPQEKKNEAKGITYKNENNSGNTSGAGSITLVPEIQESSPVHNMKNKLKSSEAEQPLYDDNTTNTTPAPSNSVAQQESPQPSSADAESILNSKTNNGKKSGIHYINENNYSEALKEFKKQYDADKNNLEAAYYSGICEKKLSKYDSAISYFNVVLANPSHSYYSKAEWQKSLALIAQGDKHSAEVLLNKIISEGKEYKDSAQVRLLQLK